MNAIRWNYYNTTNEVEILNNYTAEISAIKNFVSERTSFLSSALTVDNPEFEFKIDSAQKAKENFNKIPSAFVDGLELFLYYFCKMFSIK